VFWDNKALARHVERRLIAKDSPTTIARELAREGGIEGDAVSGVPGLRSRSRALN
jgi:hypothetical protein